MADDNTERPDYADKAVPWFVPVGIFLSVLVIILVSFNPQLLRNITSFKFAGLEAHFSSGGSATVQSGQISTLDSVLAVTIDGWANFQYVSMKDERKPTYSEAALQSERIKDGNRLFSEVFTPIFKGLQCLQHQREYIGFKNAELLKEVSLGLAEEIMVHQYPVRTSEDRDKYRDIDEEDTLSYNIKILISELNKECPVYLQAEKSTESRGLLEELRHKNGSIYQIWDSYAIQAVGDLLLIAWGRKQNVDFLVLTSTYLIDHVRKCDDPHNPCDFEAGDISLAYALIAAKIQSERPWPFDDTVDELDRTLQKINRILELPNLPAGTEGRYRKNLFSDLSMGLQLFYQRALVGKRFTPVQLQKWDDWQKEVRDVLSLVSDVGSKWPTALNDDDRRSWQSAAGEINQSPYILQDAAIGSTLSIILIASQTGEPSSADCLNARALLNYAMRENLTTYFESAGLKQDDEDSYKGFLEQVKDHIEGPCGG